MSLLVESIKIMNGRVCDIGLHEMRANHAREILFGIKIPINLRKKIHIPEEFSFGLVKCRVIYDKDVVNISFQHYHIKDINIIKLIYSQDITYNFKYFERPELDHLFEQKGDADEIMIINNGYVSDAYYYNLVFEKNNQCVTPENNLLDGVQRTKLLNHNKISKKVIHVESIIEYDKIHLINAMTPFGNLSLTQKQIIY